MKTIVAAYHNIGCAGINALIRNGFEVLAVFTYPDSPEEGDWFESVAKLAAEHGIPVYAPVDINHEIWINRIRKMEPDILFSFYYRDLICEEILNIPRVGCLNLHGSLLPKYRGRAPLNWVLVNGEKETGVTLHYMTPRPDAGDIVGQRSIEIDENDTALALMRKMESTASGLLDNFLPLIKSGTAPRIEQNFENASYYGARTPADGLIDWRQNCVTVHNLVRAVSAPYPGAFTYKGRQKIFIWSSKPLKDYRVDYEPGTVLSTTPLRVACGEGALEVNSAQAEGDIYRSGEQLSSSLNLLPGLRFNSKTDKPSRKTKILILGVNGFIGNALTQRLLESGEYEIHGMDLNDDSIERFRDEPDFHFHEGDISIHREWIEYHVKKCDVVLPLIAIATPIEYTRNPLKVFELDFEENLRIVRYCVKYQKRIIFPSTSEVYGMCEDDRFDEDSSNLVLGPINKQRWIYSSSKQLLDRVIWAYGRSESLKFTLFRPFNWIGPRLDTLESARIGSSRAITQLILNLVEGTPIQLIDGGEQKRCFTDVDEGVECLFRIIENRNNVCDSRIVNIGNPENEASIRELAEILVNEFDKHPYRRFFPSFAGMHLTESGRYYGEGYQDVQHRRPSIDNARTLLDWNPSVPLVESIRETLDYFLRDYVETQNLSPTGSASALEHKAHPNVAAQV